VGSNVKSGDANLPHDYLRGDVDPKSINPADPDFVHDAADVHRPGGFPAEKSASREHQKSGSVNWPSTATGGKSTDFSENPDYGTVGGRGSR
jgi:hypothetical protein